MTDTNIEERAAIPKETSGPNESPRNSAVESQ